MMLFIDFYFSEVRVNHLTFNIFIKYTRRKKFCFIDLLALTINRKQNKPSEKKIICKIYVKIKTTNDHNI